MNTMETEFLSIRDERPRPATRDYLPIAAVVLGAMLLVMAGRVVWYYSTQRVELGTSPLENSAQAIPPPPPTTGRTEAGPEDDTLYYAGPDVTLPVLRSKVEPRGNTSGKVLLVVVIDPSGRPVQPQIWHGLDADLNARAMQAASQWRFRPANKNGKPVPVTAQLEVSFQPDEKRP